MYNFFRNRLTNKAIEELKRNMETHDCCMLERLEKTIGKDVLDSVFKRYNIDNSTKYKVFHLSKASCYDLCETLKKDDVKNIFNDYDLLFTREVANCLRESDMGHILDAIDEDIANIDELYYASDEIEEYILN